MTRNSDNIFRAAESELATPVVRFVIRNLRPHVAQGTQMITNWDTDWEDPDEPWEFWGTICEH